MRHGLMARGRPSRDLRTKRMLTLMRPSSRSSFMCLPSYPLFLLLATTGYSLDSDYQYALIGEPRHKYLWILCRQTHMDEEIYQQLLQKAINEGYDVTKLHKTPQADLPPEADEVPKDRGVWWIKSIFGK